MLESLYVRAVFIRVRNVNGHGVTYILSRNFANVCEITIVAAVPFILLTVSGLFVLFLCGWSLLFHASSDHCVYIYGIDSVRTTDHVVVMLVFSLG